MLARRLGCRPEDLLDFSSNVDDGAAPLTAEIAETIDPALHRYADPRCVDLHRAVAGMEEVAQDMVLAANGSSEAVFLAIAGLRPRKVLVLGPAFAEYARACQGLGIEHALHALDPGADFRLTDADVAAVRGSDADMVVLCAPCNPTGAALSDAPARLATALAGRTLLMDAAYREFVHHTAHFAPLTWGGLRRTLAADTRLVLLSSFTKWGCCPGVRLGYALADPGDVERMGAVQPAWSVSQFAQDLGVALARRIGEYRALRADLPERRERMARDLAACPAIARVTPSDANFLLLRLAPGLRAGDAAEALLDERLVVRVGDTIPGLHAGTWLRAQVKADHENQRLVRALSGLAARIMGV